MPLWLTLDKSHQAVSDVLFNGLARAVAGLSTGVPVDYLELLDEQLMERLSTRDMEAFKTLYDRHGDLVYSTALRVLRDVHLAEEVAQEVFLRLW